MNGSTRTKSGPRYLAAVVLTLGWLLAVSAPALHAYVLEGWHWPSNEPIIMDLQLGIPGRPLIDGSTSWNQVADAALDVWNPYLGDGVQFQAVEDASTPSQGDGKNSVFFSANAYGEGFGDDTLAVTLTLYDTATGVASESDVIVNNAVSFDSYRGDQLSGSTGEGIYDLRRVLIHEFGHVLGLGHPSSSTVAIMDAVISNIDTVQADDINGVETIYGALTPTITSNPSAAGVTGQAFFYQITATGLRPSYGASGLPMGLTVDADTGVISGTPTVAGIYSVVISATNTAGMDTAILTLTIVAPPIITSSLTANAPLGEPFSYRIVAANGPTSFSAMGLPTGLSIDAASGVISGTCAVPGTFSVVLTASNASGQDTETLVLKVTQTDGSLVFLHGFSFTPDGAYPSTPPIQAADGNFYGTTSTSGPAYDGTVYKMTPDGTVTVIHAFSGADGSGPYTGVIQGTDGNFYGACAYGGDSQIGTVYRLTPDGILTTLHSFTAQEGGKPSRLIQAADGNFYGVTTSADTPQYATTSIFKLTPDGAFSVLYSYNDPVAETSLGSLLQVADGSFYGVTFRGSAVPKLFHFTTDGTFSIAYTFNGFGSYDMPSLSVAPDSGFYGTTTNTIFKLTPDGTLTTLHNLTLVEGTGPSALTQASDGNLYGTAYGGGDTSAAGSSVTTLNGKGTIFALKPDGTFATLYIFDGSGGVSPAGGIVQGSDGYLYGVTASGGTGNGFSGGTIFRKGLVPIPSYQVPTVILSTITPKVIIGHGGTGSLNVTLTHGPNTKIVVKYTIKGNGVNGKDYALISGKITFKPGQVSKTIPVLPLSDLGGATKTVKIILATGNGYVVGTATPTKIKLIGF